jgi:O-antigen ligase
MLFFLGGIQFYRVQVKQIPLSFLLETHLCLLIYSLVFFRSIHTSLLVLNIIFFGYTFIKQKKKVSFKKLRPEILVFTFFVLIFLNQLFFSPRLKSIDTYLHLFFYPVLFYFVKGSSFKVDIKKSMLFFIAGVFTASLSLILFNALSGSLGFKTNTFFAESLGLTHVYFGLFLGVACSFLFMLMETRKRPKIKLALCLLTGLFISIIIYIGARMALIAVVLITVIFLIKKAKKLTLKKVIFLMIVFFGSLTMSYYKIPRIKAGVYHLNNVYESVINNNKKDLIHNSWRNMYQRFLVTKYSIQEIQDNAFFGIGMQNVTQSLFEKTRKDGYLYYQPINPHNQYLHICLGMGVLSMLFFLYMLYSFIKYQPVGFYFTLFFLIIMISESVLVREKGISLFFLFTLTFFLDKKTAW